MNTRALFVALAFIVSLISCTPIESPDRAAREWVKANLEMDGLKIAERTCVEQRENAMSSGAMISALVLLTRGIVDEQYEVDISDLTFDVEYQSPDSAVVAVKGEIRIAILAAFQVVTMDDRLQMRLEDGKWKWCGMIADTAE